MRRARMRAPLRGAVPPLQANERSRALVLVLPRSRAHRLLAVGRSVLRTLGGVLLRPEDDLAVLRVHEDGVALHELAHEDLLRERVEDLLLDRALDRARAVRR